jgi:rubrerythrin
MQLDRILDRCHRLEERAAAIYRSFAATTRGQPALCALWTELAREEQGHARSILSARARLQAGRPLTTFLDGWEGMLAEVEDRLAVAERLGPAATTAEQLGAALDIEMTEMEALRRVVLAAAGAPDAGDQARHAEHLAHAAEMATDDPQVRLQVALLHARTRIQHP